MISSSSPVYSPAPSAAASPSYSPESPSDSPESPPPLWATDDDDVVFFVEPSSPGRKRSLDTEPQLDGSTVPERGARYGNQLAIRRGYTSDVVLVSLNQPHYTSCAFKERLIDGMRNPGHKQYYDPRLGDALAGVDLIDVFVDNGDEQPLVPLPAEFSVSDVAECQLRYFVRTRLTGDDDDDDDVEERIFPRRRVQREWTCRQCKAPLGESHVLTRDPYVRPRGAFWCFDCARANHIGHATLAWASTGKNEIAVLCTTPDNFFALHAVVVKANATTFDFRCLVLDQIGIGARDYTTHNVFYRGYAVDHGRIGCYGIVNGEMVQYSLE